MTSLVQNLLYYGYSAVCIESVLKASHAYLSMYKYLSQCKLGSSVEIIYTFRFLKKAICLEDVKLTLT